MGGWVLHGRVDAVRGVEHISQTNNIEPVYCYLDEPQSMGNMQKNTTPSGQCMGHSRPHK